MSFDLSEYVDVAERIRIFRGLHPAGALQSTIEVLRSDTGTPIAVLAKAFAYRDPDDAIPGIGHSWMQIPGLTSFTKGSEVENAETSAWGRAIVAALAADTKKVASADEVRAKSGAASSSVSATGQEAGSGDAAGPASTTGWVWPFGKWKGKTLDETEDGYLDWFLEHSDKDDIKDRIREFRNLGELQATFAGGSFDDTDIPF